MPEQEYIRYAYEKKGLSISEIARRTDVSWRTAAKYAKRDDWNRVEQPQRRQPVMDAYADIVDTWLLEDQLLPRKQRRNAAAIFRELQKECGFTGAERTVREYVHNRRRDLLQQEETPYVELAHPAAEAQADFGMVKVIQDGKLVEIRTLVLSFPFSNAGFSQPLPAENQECLLEGLKRLFVRIGGVPRRIRFDNLAAAVAQVGKGEEREVTEMFRRFMLHYRFDPEFCAPGKGNEKGNVEAKVGYTRRQWLCPLQGLESYDKLADQLWIQAHTDMQRPHYKQGETIASLWEQEKASLLALPTTPFEVSKLDHAVLNRLAQFRWEGGTYMVPQGKPNLKVLLTAFWDRIEVRDGRGQLLTTLTRQYLLREQEIDWVAHFEIYARRPRAAVHAALFPYLPDSVQRFLKEAEPTLRASRVRLLRDVLKQHPMDGVAQALEALPLGRQDDRASLEQKLYALDPANATPNPLVERQTPPEVTAYEPDTSCYDQLSPARSKEGSV